MKLHHSLLLAFLTLASKSLYASPQDNKIEGSEKFEVEFEALHHKLIGTKNALDFARGKGVIVAITDSGIDYNHFDLKDNIWFNEGETGVDQNGQDLCKNGIDDDQNGKIDDCLGWNWANKNNDPMPLRDKDQHGSHVAGIVASMENGSGSVGVAPDAKVMALRILPSHWTAQKIYDSYIYAVDNGAKIINTSLEIDQFVGSKV